MLFFLKRFEVSYIFLLSGLISSVYGQDSGNAVYTLPGSKILKLHSKTVGQTYKLYISTPPGYKADKSYPVVYLLDADYSFAIVKNMTDHLTERRELEGLLLVGIAYDGVEQYRLHRTRDYTPIYSAEGGYSPEIQSNSGGGPNFIKFLEQELFPFIHSTFRVNDTKCLVGHSYGGLLASYILFSNSRLFNKYVIVSPSVWYADKYLLQVEEGFAKNQQKLDADVYLAVGSLESERMLSDTDSLLNQIRNHKYANFNFKNETLQSETHNSVFPSAVSTGLRFVFNAR